MSKIDELADTVAQYLKKEDEQGQEHKQLTSIFCRFAAGAIIFTMLAGIAVAMWQHLHSTSGLEKEITTLEKQLKTQEDVIIKKRQENDTRVKTKVQEAYQEIEDLNEDELDSKWLEFMDGVRKRNYEREQEQKQSLE